MREASFDGTSESLLPYSYLDLVSPTNNPSNPFLAVPGLGLSANGAQIISLSFVPQGDEGVLLATFNEVCMHITI